ncbi:phosphopentomutase [Clostridiaceae bacterium M8S5]|nr:phosphopentomutase [Clostridiaceae bacterium M8S5]
MAKKVVLLVIDSLGVGQMDDVTKVRPQDNGANTLKHILDKAEYIELPNLEKLGLKNIINHNRLNDAQDIGAYGKIKLQHYGADSYVGHQEIMGTKPLKPYTKPFKDVIDDVKIVLKKEGYKVSIPDKEKPYLLVNDCVYVADNIETDYGQIYNVTASFDYISYEEVLNIGRIVRECVKVNRVIALGGEDVTKEWLRKCVEVRDDGLIGINSPKSGVYQKGYKCRHMGYGVDPKGQVSTILMKNGIDVTLIGKMQDVIDCDGATKIPAVDTELVMKSIVESFTRMKHGFISATVQETDLAGHAQDVDKYAHRLMVVDKYIGLLMDKMRHEDVLIISADHGNDPTIGHSQHTRENVLLLVYGKNIKKDNLGIRKTLSDIGATVAEYFNVHKPENGSSFLN